jgi:hypothetical protein
MVYHSHTLLHPAYDLLAVEMVQLQFTRAAPTASAETKQRLILYNLPRVGQYKLDEVD